MHLNVLFVKLLPVMYYCVSKRMYNTLILPESLPRPSTLK